MKKGNFYDYEKQLKLDLYQSNQYFWVKSNRKYVNL